MWHTDTICAVGVTVVALNRVEGKNSMSKAMIAEVCPGLVVV